MFDYEVLRFVWWLLVGVLLIGFAVTDGFDMGVGVLSRIIGKTDTERRIMINAVAPHWEGNQVWLVTAGGALFAAWPMVYAAAFSGFYVAMILVLASLFFRPVGFVPGTFQLQTLGDQFRGNGGIFVLISLFEVIDMVAFRLVLLAFQQGQVFTQIDIVEIIPFRDIKEPAG